MPVLFDVLVDAPTDEGLPDVSADALILGAGIAGLSIAAELSRDMRVLVLEREWVPAYHSTSRSAAMLIESYGGAVMEHFISASRSFFVNPPQNFSPVPLSRPRGLILLAEAGQESELAEACRTQHSVQELTIEQLLKRVPVVRESMVCGAMAEDTALDLDVDALCQGYQRQIKSNAGHLVCGASVSAVQQALNLWQVDCGGRCYKAPLLVNATGAWADKTARMAGLPPVGLVPHKRSAAVVEFSRAADREWPMIANLIGENWYARPEGEWLMVSLADETPMEPYDAWADDLDIAEAIDNMQRMLEIGEVRKLVRSWAGLRTFAGDRQPVVGFEPLADGFFWFAGQGGSGIHAAPALASTAAKMIVGGSSAEGPGLPNGLREQISPARFRMPRDI